MSVSAALEKSARDFSLKYACDFDFTTFESRVEEFTFLRPVGGWLDVYKMTFEQLYRSTLEKVAMGMIDDNLDAEAMMDDFEYTLIKPYVNEGDKDIKHKPYVGMDRISRLEYLDQLTKSAPSNFVELYAEKYKKGELSVKQMRDVLAYDGHEREHYTEIAGYVQALENVNNSRSLVWRAFHPFKNSSEKRNSALLKRTFMEKAKDGEELYREISDEAKEPFDRYQKVNANLEHGMLLAREEMNRKQKMNDVMRESIRIEGFEKESVRELSPKVEQYHSPVREKQF